MALLLNILITLIALAATSVLLPTIPLGVLRLGLRGVGWFIRKRTRSRREYIISRVRAEEEEELQAKRGGKLSPSTTQAEDEDWEKVDTSSVGTAGNNHNNGQKNRNGQGPGDESWDGIIGFFHPFWYVSCVAMRWELPL